MRYRSRVRNPPTGSPSSLPPYPLLSVPFQSLLCRVLGLPVQPPNAAWEALSPPPQWVRPPDSLRCILPRDAMRQARSLMSTGVHPSVRLSVRYVRVLYPDDWRYRQTSFLAHIPIILVFFDPERRYQTPRETPAAGRKISGVGKICDFRLKSPPFIS